MKNKKTILIIAIVIIIIFTGVKFFTKPSNSVFDIFTVFKGTITQEVSESGTVKMGDNVNLNFKIGGRIENIYVKVGDKVAVGQKLAKLDTNQLSIQLAQAQANFNAQKARLSELQEAASTDLKGLYNNTPAILNQAYNLANSAIKQQLPSFFNYNSVSLPTFYELNYKNCNSQATADASFQRKIVENKLNNWSADLQSLTQSPAVLDATIENSGNYLTIIQNFLNRLNDTLTNTDCGLLTPSEIATVNSYKPTVTTVITSINTAMTSVSTQKKYIADQKLAVQNYFGNNQEMTYQELLVRQAEEGAILLQDQIRDTVLLSPSQGQIAQINSRIGELVQPTQSFIVFMPTSPFEIKTNIYEEDIVKIEIGNPVEIKITSFPDKIFEGKVISIDPAATMIDGIVYFGVRIEIQNPPQGTRSGMSADITIKTEHRNDVLVIPRGAITQKDGKDFVQIIKDEKSQDREVRLGLEGSTDMIEVLSGLSEGEKIVVPK